MTTGGTDDKDNKDKKGTSQSEFSMHQQRVKVLPVDEEVDPETPLKQPDTTTQDEDETIPLLSVGEQQLVEESTKKMVNKVSKALDEDNTFQKFNREIAFYTDRINSTQDPIKKQYSDLKEATENEKKLYEGSKTLEGDIKKAKTELVKTQRSQQAEEKLFHDLEEIYNKDKSPQNKDMMDKSKARLEKKNTDIESLKGTISAKENELLANGQIREELQKQSAELKKDLSGKDPKMKEFAEKEAQKEKELVAKKAALNKYSPEGKLQLKKKRMDKASENKEKLDKNVPQIKDYPDGAQLLGAMIAWLFMMLLAMLGNKINKATLKRAEKRLNNKTPMLKGMKNLADKRYKLANEIEKLEKKTPRSPEEEKKLANMKVQLAKMDDGLKAYQERLAKIGEFKGERNEVRKGVALEKKAAAQEDLSLAQAYQKDLSKKGDFLNEELAKNKEEIDKLKALAPLDEVQKEKLAKLEQQKGELENNIKATSKEKDNADKLVNHAQARIDEADKELDKVTKKENKNLDQVAKEAQILNKDVGIDMGETEPQVAPTTTPPTSDKVPVLEVQPPAPKEKEEVTDLPEPTHLGPPPEPPQVQSQVEPPKPQPTTNGGQAPTTVSSTTTQSTQSEESLGLKELFNEDQVEDKLIKLTSELVTLQKGNEELQGVTQDLGPSSDKHFGPKAPHANDKHDIKKEMLSGGGQGPKKPGEKEPLLPKEGDKKSTVAKMGSTSTSSE